MPDFKARIGRVRMKAGGADVRVFPTALDDNNENLRGKLIGNAKAIAGYDGEMDGYLVIGLWTDGARSLGFRIPPRIPREMLPHYVAEIIRSDAVTDHEAERTFERMFEWRD